MNEKNHIYFKGLDGLRAIAAIGVLVAHVFLDQHHFGFIKTGSLPIGRYGVTIFFTLSGFLITSLLVKEKESNGKLAFKEFYMRRILRIWPLYFFYIIFCLAAYIFLFDINPEHLQFLLLYILFLPNIAFNLNLYPQSTGHLWSIGIEEQFYFFWPWIVQKISNLKRFIYIFIIAVISVKLLAILVSHQIGNKIPQSILSSLRYDCMAIGAFFAIIANSTTWLTKVNKHKQVINIVFGMFFLSSFFIPSMEYFSILGDDIIAMITGLFILSQIQSQSKYQLLEMGAFKFFGKISFGIYIYHPIVLAFFRYILYRNLEMNFQNIVFLTLAVLLTTVILAYASFIVLESYFLRMKDRFAAAPTSII